MDDGSEVMDVLVTLRSFDWDWWMQFSADEYFGWMVVGEKMYGLGEDLEWAGLRESVTGGL